MADIEKQIFDAQENVRKAKFLLDSVNSQAKRSGQATPAQTKAKAAYDAAVKRLEALRKEQTTRKTKKEKGAVPATATESTFNDTPFVVSNKILQEFQNENPGAIVDKNFFSTGQGSGLLVYTGKTMGKTASPTGGTYNQVKDATNLTMNEINRFNSDATLKNRVTAMVRKFNPKADEIDAWNAWQAVVADAAKLYAGGNGIKITPEDLLNRQLAKSQKDAPYTGPETTLARKVYDEATIKSWMEEGLLKYLQKPSLDPKDMADLQASILAMTSKYNKTVVTDNRKGKRTITETPAFSEAQIQSTIKKFAQEKDPVAYERTKSMAFFDWAMGLGD